MKFIAEAISDFLSPRHCVVCNIYIGVAPKHSNFICDKCYDNIPFAEDKSFVLNRFKSNFLGDCAISEATSLMNISKNDNYLEIIHALKYLKFKSVAYEFGELLANRIKIDNLLDYDYILPIPIHTAKKRERGFNQSDMIAESLAKFLNKNFRTDIICRKKYTTTQTKLDKSGRMNNMVSVFSVVKSELVKNKTFLLVDDVLTTGSTINSAAKTLLDAGALRVGAATIALANS